MACGCSTVFSTNLENRKEFTSLPRSLTRSWYLQSPPSPPRRAFIVGSSMGPFSRRSLNINVVFPLRSNTNLFVREKYINTPSGNVTFPKWIFPLGVLFMGLAVISVDGLCRFVFGSIENFVWSVVGFEEWLLFYCVNLNRKRSDDTWD